MTKSAVSKEVTLNSAASVDLDTSKHFTDNFDITIGVDVEVTASHANPPIMGFVYAPTDVVGAQISVQTDLWDAYYQLDETSTIPKLFAGPRSLSYNATNDQYNVWAIK